MPFTAGSQLPQGLTMQALGSNGFDFYGWISILAPAGTSAAIVRCLQAEISKAVASDEDSHRPRRAHRDAVTLP